MYTYTTVGTAANIPWVITQPEQPPTQLRTQLVSDAIRRISTSMDTTFTMTFDQLGGAANDLVSTLNDAISNVLGMGRVQRDIGPLSTRDLENITLILNQQPPHPNRETLYDKLSFFRSTTVDGCDRYVCYTKHGGFMLLFQNHRDQPFVMSTDIGDMVTTERLNEYRTQVGELCKKMDADGLGRLPVIPVGQTAMYRGPHGNSRDRNKLRAIDVDFERMESVFAVEDAYYLSGYDDQETPKLYFLCRLPHAVSGIVEARESLKPESVKTAEAQGKAVLRQGDLFAVPCQADWDEMSKAGGKLYEYDPAVNGRCTAAHGLYGTVHTATQVMKMPSGIQLARGTMVHDPRLRGESRQADHHPLVLGDQWHFVIPNTVPKN